MIKEVNVRKSIYVLYNEYTKQYKIGVSNELKVRKRALESSSGVRLSVMYESPLLYNSYEMEQLIHKKLKEYRTIGEWFMIDYSLIDECIKSVSHNFKIELELQKVWIRSPIVRNVKREIKKIFPNREKLNKESIAQMVNRNQESLGKKPFRF